MNSAGFSLHSRLACHLLCLLAALLTAGVSASEPDQAKPRCALVSTAVPEVSTLVEAKLLESETADWLERNEIDRILAERKLTASFDLGAVNQHVAMGQLLKADLLVLMRSGEIAVPGKGTRGSKAVRIDLVVAETSMGLRLTADSMVLSEDLESDAENLITAVERAIEKHRESVRDLYAVPPFMSHDLGGVNDYLMESYAALIERFLMIQPGALVVETAEAEAIAREFELADPAERVQRRLPIYIWGEFRHEGHGDSLRVTLTLRAKRGDAVLKEASRTIRPSEAPDWLVATTTEFFADSSGNLPHRIDMAAEAHDVTQRTEEYLGLGNYREALTMAELGVLIASDQVEARALAIRATMRLARSLDWRVPENHGKKLRLGRRSLQHLQHVMTMDAVEKMDLATVLLPFEALLSSRSPELREHNQRLLKAARELAYRFADANAWQESNACLFTAIGFLPPGEAAEERFEFLVKYDDRMDLRLKMRLCRNGDTTPSEEIRRFLSRALAREDIADDVKDLIRDRQKEMAEWDQQQLESFARRPTPRGTSSSSEEEGVSSRITFRAISFSSTSDTRDGSSAQPILRPLMLDDGTDVFWSSDSPSYYVARPGEAKVIRRSANSAERITTDGRYLWIVRSTMSKGSELLVVDPTTGRSWPISSEHGLPPAVPRADRVGSQRGQSLRVVPVNHGEAIVIGFQNDTWLAHAIFNPNGDHDVRVFHEARNILAAPPREARIPGDFRDEIRQDLHAAFRPGQVAIWTFPTQERRIIIPRGSLTSYVGGVRPLIVDPETLAVSVRPKGRRGYYSVDGFFLHHQDQPKDILQMREALVLQLSRYQAPEKPPKLIATGVPEGRLLIHDDTVHIIGRQWTRVRLSTGTFESFGDTPWSFANSMALTKQPRRDTSLVMLERSNHYGIVVSCARTRENQWQQAFAQVVFDGSGVSLDEIFDRQNGEVKSVDTIKPVDLGKRESLWDGGSSRNATDLAYSPDGQLVVTTQSTANGSVQLWNGEDGQFIGDAISQEPGMHRVAFSPSGDFFATASMDGTVIIWDARRRKPLHRFMSEELRDLWLAFSWDDHLLAMFSYTSDRDHDVPAEVKIWEPSSGQEVGTLATYSKPLGMTRDGRVILSNTIYLSTVTFGEQLEAPTPIDERRRRWSTVPRYVGGLLPDGTLISKTQSGPLIAWDCHDFTFRKLWDDTPDLPVAISADGRRVAFSRRSGPFDDRQKAVGTSVWDIATQTEVARADKRFAKRWVFSPDGKWLVSASGGGVYRLEIPE